MTAYALQQPDAPSVKKHACFLLAVPTARTLACDAHVIRLARPALQAVPHVWGC